MKKCLWLLLISMHGYSFSSFVITFYNKTKITIDLEMHLKDHSVNNEHISMAASFDFVNHLDNPLDYIIFSSQEKDKNGNLYTSLQQSFPQIVNNKISYDINLEDVAPYTVAATKDTEEFQMPATQKITCTLEQPAPVQQNNKKAVEISQNSGTAVKGSQVAAT